MKDVLSVKALELTDVPGLTYGFGQALSEVAEVIGEIDRGRLKPGSAVTFTATVTLTPKRQGIEVDASFKVAKPKYKPSALHAMQTSDGFVFYEAEQEQLPFNVTPFAARES